MVMVMALRFVIWILSSYLLENFHFNIGSVKISFHASHSLDCDVTVVFAVNTVKHSAKSSFTSNTLDHI